MTSQPAKQPGDCSKCGGHWSVGDPISFEKASRLDGSTYNKPVHAVCPAKTGSPTPPKDPPAAGGIMVEIGAWVPIDKVDLILKAIREAKS